MAKSHTATRSRGARKAGPPHRRRNRAGGARSTSSVDSTERLQKVMAAAGIASRRHCEEMILAGRVEVDRQLVVEPGVKVDPLRQEIRVDGSVVPRPCKVYYAVNKPRGVLSTSHDPAGRMRVIDLVGADRQRVYTVGRLDKSSEGLILVTNDGHLADRLTHPRYGVEKTYEAFVAGDVTRQELARLLKGIQLAEGTARPSRLRIKARRKNGTLLEMVLTEGRNREIRRMLARVGHKVQRLRRVAIAGLRLGDMPPGAVRPLRPDEVRRLERAAEGGARGESKSSGSAATPQPAKPRETRRPRRPPRGGRRR